MSEEVRGDIFLHVGGGKGKELFWDKVSLAFLPYSTLSIIIYIVA